MTSSGLTNKQVSQETLEEFFQFLQCQLCMEAREIFGEDLELKDPKAKAIWHQVSSWIQPNLGKKEKWMPFHTVLGVHELFIVEHIHHGSGEASGWDEKQKFLAIFVFRAHCKSPLFLEAQLPLMKQKSFWRDPLFQFADEGPVTKAMLKYRRETRQPLQTNAFLAIPERLCEDDDENLARNVAVRTRTLLQVAEKIWPLISDETKNSQDKFEEISKAIQSGRRLGETWSKMIMVSIDIAYPKLRLLADNCDVGTGAVKGLSRLTSSGTSGLEARSALAAVTSAANGCALPSVEHFWDLLGKVEGFAARQYERLPKILQQVSTARNQLSAVTVQVQLCEWRQFQDYLEKAGPTRSPEQPESEPTGGISRRISTKRRRIETSAGSTAAEETNAGSTAAEDSDDDKPLMPASVQKPPTGTAIQAPEDSKRGPISWLKEKAERQRKATYSSSSSTPPTRLPEAGTPEALYLEELCRYSKPFKQALSNARAAAKEAGDKLADAESRWHDAMLGVERAAKEVTAAEQDILYTETMLQHAALRLRRAEEKVQLLEDVFGTLDELAELGTEGDVPDKGRKAKDALESLHNIILQHSSEANRKRLDEAFANVSASLLPGGALKLLVDRSSNSMSRKMQPSLQALTSEEEEAEKQQAERKEAYEDLMDQCQAASERRRIALASSATAKQAFEDAVKNMASADSDYRVRRMEFRQMELQDMFLEEMLAS